MHTVADLMTRDVLTVSPADDLSLAETVLALGGIRHLPVVDGNQRLVGLISHRDVLRTCSNLPPEAKRAMLAGEVMTRGLHTVRSFTPLEQALTTILHYKIGCLPVVDEKNHLIGILTEADVVRFALTCVSRLEALASRPDHRLHPQPVHALPGILK